MWDTILQGASSTGQALINWGTAKYNTDKTNQANMDMAKYAYSKDLEMWNRQNAYNSPEAQMARYKDAGLNPNLIYGSGGSAGNASTMPRYNAPTMRYNYEPPNVAGAIQTYQDMKLKQAQIDLVNEQLKGRQIANDANKNTAVGKAINDLNYSLWRSVSERGRARSNVFSYNDKANELAPLLSDMFKAKVDMLNTQILKYQNDAKRSAADTLLRGAELELKNKDINWYTANQIYRMFSGVATGLGLAGIGRSMFGNRQLGVPTQTMSDYYNSMSNLNSARARYYNKK